MTGNGGARYAARDLAVLVPTKDRPEKLANLLDSLAAQPDICGRIVIIDGGDSVRDVVMRYAGRLPVEHHVCQPPGQIRQRNMGIALLDQRTPLVASLDDDIVLEAGAVAAMIAFWNRCEPDTAGVSFNIVNVPPEPRSRVKELLGLSAPEPGRVLRSGATTANTSVERDVRVQWLCGGATVWQLDVLRRFTHEDVPARWAIGEDLIFSYPVGRERPLYVCAAARVRHEHVFDYAVNTPYRFHGRTRTLWLFYFIESNRELSRLAFLWMMTLTTLGKFALGAATLRGSLIQFALGQIEGVSAGVIALARGEGLASAIERESRREQGQSVTT